MRDLVKEMTDFHEKILAERIEHEMKKRMPLLAIAIERLEKLVVTDQERIMRDRVPYTILVQYDPITQTTTLMTKNHEQSI